MNTVLNFIEKTVAQHPDRIAVDDDVTVITYRELHAQYSAIGTGIMKACPGVMNRPVVVYLPKSTASVVSFMGALASGNMYVPVDYKVPLYRLSAMLDNLDPIMIVTDEAGKSNLEELGYEDRSVLFAEIVSTPADYDALAERKASVIDTDPAYIMYTSGSTGVPKGVVIAHRGIVNYATWLVKEFSITEQSVLGLQSGFHFDNSVFDMYTCFFTGGRLVIIPEILFMYPAQLLEFIDKKKVSCVFWVPTVMINVANSGALTPGCLPTLKTVVFAGEVMPNAQLNIWRRAMPDRLYANLYGPTEITVDCTYYIVDREFDDGDKLPIGIPVPNTRILILDENNKECATGEHGELCVAGCCLALGYWNNEEMTQKAFVQNPLNTRYQETIYRTGDIAYRDEEGLIMYVGRRDSQFKLRGNRIELGDIETAAMCLDFVSSACALFDAVNEKIILVIQSSEEIGVKKINRMLGKLIPQYMLPKDLVVLESMPLTSNKKIDRKFLSETYVGK